MKNFYVLFLVFMHILSVSGQKVVKSDGSINGDLLMKEVKSLADKFCTYVEQVGSYGTLSDKMKDNIINVRVPDLFLRYMEEPRKMITSSGAHGEHKREKPMYQYMNYLKIQSHQPGVCYDLYFSGILNSNIKNLSTWKKDVLDDGSILYTNKIKICQWYYITDFANNDPEKRKVLKKEKDEKEMEVLLLQQRDRRYSVYLGDVKRVRRINN